MLWNGRKALAARDKVMPGLYCKASYKLVVVFLEEAWLPRLFSLAGHGGRQFGLVVPAASSCHCTLGPQPSPPEM